LTIKRCTAAPSIPCSAIHRKCRSTAPKCCAEYSEMRRPSGRLRSVSQSESGGYSVISGSNSTRRCAASGTLPLNQWIQDVFPAKSPGQPNQPWYPAMTFPERPLDASGRLSASFDAPPWPLDASASISVAARPHRATTLASVDASVNCRPSPLRNKSDQGVHFRRSDTRGHIVSGCGGE